MSRARTSRSNTVELTMNWTGCLTRCVAALKALVQTNQFTRLQVSERGLPFERVPSWVNISPSTFTVNGWVLPTRPAARYARFEQWSSHLLTAVVLFAVFDGMANDGKLMAKSFAPLGNLAHLLVRTIVYG